MNIIYFIILILIKNSKESSFYGFSILFLILGIYLFTRFQDIKKIIYRNKLKEYYYVNKKVFFKSLISLEIIGIVLSFISFYLSTIAETFYFKIISIFFVLYPIYFTLKIFLQGNGFYKKIRFDILSILLIPLYFIKKDSFVNNVFYMGIIIFILYLFYTCFIFFRCNFHFKEKEKREEIKVYSKTILKDIFIKNIDFSFVLFIKCLLEIVLCIFFYKNFALEEQVFLREISNYFIWYFIILYPIYLCCNKIIDKVQSNSYAKTIGITSFILIFMSIMINFFSSDILFIIYHENSSIFHITCFSLFFLSLLSYFWEWNNENKSKINIKQILFYVLAKIIGSILVTHFSYIINITPFEAYFIYEEILLFILIYINLKMYNKQDKINYPVIRYKILKITLCSLIVYAAVLNITHLYQNPESWLLKVILFILLIIFSVFLYFYLSVKSHLLYSIINIEDVKKLRN